MKISCAPSRGIGRFQLVFKCFNASRGLPPMLWFGYILFTFICSAAIAASNAIWLLIWISMIYSFQSVCLIFVCCSTSQRIYLNECCNYKYLRPGSCQVLYMIGSMHSSSELYTWIFGLSLMYFGMNYCVCVIVLYMHIMLFRSCAQRARSRLLYK